MNRIDCFNVSRNPGRLVLSAAASVLALAGAAAGGQLGADMNYRIVAKTGDAAPGGSSFTTFGVPVAAADGRVAFQADLSAIVNASGVYVEPSVGVLDVAAREGGEAPGFLPTTYGRFEPEFHSPVINASGEIAFSNRLVANNIPDGWHGVMRYSGGELEAVALPFFPAPCGGGALYGHISNVVGLGDGGDVAFYGYLTGNGVADGNDTGVFVGQPGAMTCPIREGDQAPQYAAADFGDAYFNRVLVNAHGEVAVRNYLHTDDGAKFSMWRGEAGSMKLVAVAGQTAPNGGTFGGGGFGDGNHSLNDQEAVLFPAIAGNEIGLWRKGATPSATVAYPGDPILGGLSYQSVDASGAQLDGSGAALFHARLDGPGVNEGNDSALVRRSPGGATEILLREGDAAPGLAPGITIGDVWTSVAVFNSAGGVLHWHSLEGPAIDDSNDRVLYLTVDGVTEPVMYEGQWLNAGGVFKKISGFAIASGMGPESGRRGGITAFNQAAVRVTFFDDTEAIVVATPADDCPGDLNDDGVVDSLDLNIMLAAFGGVGEVGMLGDIDLDGDVDSIDLNVVLADFGQLCNPV